MDPSRVGTSQCPALPCLYRVSNGGRPCCRRSACALCCKLRPSRIAARSAYFRPSRSSARPLTHICTGACCGRGIAGGGFPGIGSAQDFSDGRPSLANAPGAGRLLERVRVIGEVIGQPLATNSLRCASARARTTRPHDRPENAGSECVAIAGRTENRSNSPAGAHGSTFLGRTSRTQGSIALGSPDILEGFSITHPQGASGVSGQGPILFRDVPRNPLSPICRWHRCVVDFALDAIEPYPFGPFG